MNFKIHFEEGRAGRNVGMSTGIPALTKAIGGIQKKRIYGIAASPKVGKSTLCDFSFVISPYEEALLNGTINDLEWIYFCFDNDRIDKEFKFAAHYFGRDYGIYNFMHQGKLIGMSSEYLAGKKIGEDGNCIRVSDEHFEIIKKIYVDKIIPLFGEYDETGKKISQGKITIITERDNPTGIRNLLIANAEKHGKFLYEQYYTNDEKGKRVLKQRIVGYQPNDLNRKLIIITDTIRKLKFERGFKMKENIDKYLEYQTELRDWCHFIFVDIVHINRNLSAIDRLKFAGEFIYPTGEDVKDTSNLSEDCNVLMTMFNPNDEKYGLEKHFGYTLANYPNYRSIHIVESRDTECPLHIQTNMFGGVNMFQGI
jgi:hypothetical protein